jgi:hypothetical protein
VLTIFSMLDTACDPHQMENALRAGSHVPARGGLHKTGHAPAAANEAGSKAAPAACVKSAASNAWPCRGKIAASAWCDLAPRYVKMAGWSIAPNDWSFMRARSIYFHALRTLVTIPRCLGGVTC